MFFLYIHFKIFVNEYVAHGELSTTVPGRLLDSLRLAFAVTLWQLARAMSFASSAVLRAIFA